MVQRSRRKHGFFVVTLLLALACSRDGKAWEAELAGAQASRLIGLWTMHLRTDRSPGVEEGARSAGEIAFTLNAERLSGKGADHPPMLFGTYTIDFTPLGFGAGSGADVPEAEATLTGNSVSIMLAPGSAVPIALRGAVSGDSISGRWQTTRRSGVAAMGEFVLRRP
jgi:hypothetical protein